MNHLGLRVVQKFVYVFNRYNGADKYDKPHYRFVNKSRNKKVLF